MSTASPPTLYAPIIPPPTPAPSPRPLSLSSDASNDIAHLSRFEFASLAAQGPTARQRYLAAILSDCTPAELLFISTSVAPLLKHDFLRELPVELALQILGHVDQVKTLIRASCVSKHWYKLCRGESIWKRMCLLYRIGLQGRSKEEISNDPDILYAKMHVRMSDIPVGGVPMPPPPPTPPLVNNRREKENIPEPFSYRRHFEYSFKTAANWRTGGRLLRTHRSPSTTPDTGVVTSVAMDHSWIVVGLANSRIHVFSAKTGVLSRTLVGHNTGVWTIHLVSRGGRWLDPPAGSHSSQGAGSLDQDQPPFRHFTFDDHHVPPTLRTAVGLDRLRPIFGVDGDGDDEMRGLGGDGRRYDRPSDVCGASEGWGQPNALVVSGGCDKALRVWDVKTGYCIYVLQGHTSTIRCTRVLHNRPVAVSGSRDQTLRVWDIQRGVCLRVLAGHEESVRCLDIFGNRVVSGSYDCTCRMWDVDTGECLRVFRGHLHQIYCVSYDGTFVASGGLDTIVRVWDPNTGECLAKLPGHTALVCQLQLSPWNSLSSASLHPEARSPKSPDEPEAYPRYLITGGSDGRIIKYSLDTFERVGPPIAAHDSSVTSLQFSEHITVTGGNDGKVKLYDTQSAAYIRDLTQPAEAIWKIAFKGDKCVIMCKRAGKTVMEIWSFRPGEEDD